MSLKDELINAAKKELDDLSAELDEIAAKGFKHSFNYFKSQLKQHE